MGLLDDAIRDHLELKRRRGADPGEVAREEHEALDPVVTSNTDAWEGQPESEGEVLAATDVPDDESKSTLPDEEHPTETHVQLPTHGEPALTSGQETAELDMESVLAEDPQEAAGAGGEPRHEAAGGHSLEWETPRDEGIAPTSKEVTPFEEDVHSLSLDQVGHWDEPSGDEGDGAGHPTGQGRLSLE